MILASIFIPHGHCYLWKHELLGLHIVSDALIALAYYSIPFSLTYFVQKRRDIPYNWIFIFFSVFIVFCGTSHVLEIWTLWHPNYWLSGYIKALCAVASLCAAIALIKLMPKMLEIPSTEQFSTVKAEIAERQRVQAELTQTVGQLQQALYAAETANLAKSEFLARMSHELRTPLNSILGFTQLMQSDTRCLPEHRKRLNIVNRNGKQLLGLINDVLEMSKIEAARVQMNETAFDLHRLLNNLESTLVNKAKSKQLTLNFHRNYNVPQYIILDEIKLRKILLNLLCNAIKFTDKGSVTLNVSADIIKKTTVTYDKQLIAKKGHFAIKFQVCDTGCGIAKEEINNLFEPFEQGASTQGKMREGTGLGLTISRSFVRLMGGDITVNSVLGKGSVFEFDIPVKLADLSQVQTQPVSSQVKFIAQDRVRYIYTEELSDFNQNNSSHPYNLTKEDLGVMPSEWVQKLYLAASAGSDSNIFQLLQEVPEQYTNLVAVLHDHAYNFQFDKIIELTK